MKNCTPLTSFDPYLFTPFDTDNNDSYSFLNESVNKFNFAENDNVTVSMGQFGPGLIEVILYRWVILAIVCFGICGNLLNLTVLTSKSLSKTMGRMEMSAHIGLVALAVSDLMFCVVVVPKSFLPFEKIFNTDVTFLLVYDTYGDAVINIFETSSTWLTVSMAFSRYMAICHPFKARMFVGRTFAKVNVLIVFLASVAFNLPRFFSQKIGSVDCQEGYNKYFTVPDLIYSQKYAQIYIWLHFILCVVLPFILMAFCNFFLISEVRNAPKKIQRQTTREKKRNNSTYLLTLTLTLIVVIYILLVIPAELTNFVRHFIEIETNSVFHGYNISVAVLNTLKTLNFAVNFILYCSVNAQFRTIIRDLFCGRNKNQTDVNATLQQTEYSRISNAAEKPIPFLSDKFFQKRNSSCV